MAQDVRESENADVLNVSSCDGYYQLRLCSHVKILMLAAFCRNVFYFSDSMLIIIDQRANRVLQCCLGIIIIIAGY